MALINCSHCGNKVSDLAEKCPKCQTSIQVTLEALKVKPVESAAPVEKENNETVDVKKNEPEVNEFASEQKKPAGDNKTNNADKKEKTAYVPPVKKKNYTPIIAASIIVGIVVIFISIKLFGGSNNNSPSMDDYQTNSAYDQTYENEQDEDYNSTSDYETNNNSSSKSNGQNYETNRNQQPSAEDLKKQMYRDNIGSYVYCETNNYKQKLLGGIKDLQITLTNNMDYEIESAEVAVFYYKLNDELYAKEIIYFYNIPAHSWKRQSAPETNVGTYVRTSVKQVNSSAFN